MDQLGQLQKAIAFTKDHGLTIGLFNQMLMDPIVASNSATEVWIPVMVTFPSSSSNYNPGHDSWGGSFDYYDKCLFCLGTFIVSFPYKDKSR